MSKLVSTSGKIKKKKKKKKKKPPKIVDNDQNKYFSPTEDRDVGG
jgi:hypothetical protein